MCDTRERRLIGLIDVDGHNFPNLCLMKLSSYHKSIGDVVEWWVNDKSKNYDIVYMSKVFGDEYTADVQEPENAKKVIKGGTGYAIKLENGKEVYHKELDSPLPFEIESVYPDYSLYPEYTGYGKPLSKQTAYGFLTRGCPRGCSFCHVAVKEGRCSRKVADLSQFWKGQGTICLSDPNILACSEWEQLLTQLRDSGAKIEFNQGLDARLITEKKAELLASMNLKTPHFAMDTMASLEPVKKGIKLYVNACKRIRGKWNWRNAKVFCLTNFDTTHEQDMQRISAIQECECQPYVMIYNKPSAPSITRRLQRWTNSTMLYAKTQDFMEYQRMNYKSVLEGSDEKRMRLVTYDCEVFAYDWLVTLKDKETGQRTRIWNDNEALKMALSDDCIYVGFNSKHYDQFIVKAIAADFTPQEIKKVNDFIIGGGQGWDCPLLKDFYFAFNNVDIKDDMQMGLSLKAIEGHLGISVQESTVPFDIDRPLTEAERRETEFYCDHDVDTAERLIDIRKDYLKNKVHIGRLAGLSDVKAMGMTNAKLTAAMLKATKKPHDDERKYVYPENLKREYIPPEVFAFFDKMYDPSISDKELFSGKLEFQIGDCPGVVGYGGIHAAIPHYFFEETGDRVIRNKDVASYYPHLMTLCGYTSRNIPSAEVFENVLDTRMKAKASGDKATANALKLVVNTTYGALLNKYNDLFDPLMGRSVCITGQLFLLELAQHLYRDIPGLKIVQLNTDGIMVECDRADLEKLDEICDEWQARTGFELEEDSVSKIAQKDVNNYVEVQPNGKSKAKGGYLVKGISTAGAFNINNSCCIVATALKEYFVNGILVEETINGCDDIFQFQIIAKAGAKYREAYHLVDGVKEPVQKVNRVYATADERYGKLFKVKAEDESTAKIEMLPEHCIIDNDNRLSITDVDKTFYIEMAKKRVNDFMGVKPERKRRTRSMATTKTTKEISKETNVYQRLLAARAKFLEADVQKTGKNMHLSFKYFELNDIVPPATRIFTEVGLVGLVNFTADTATMTIINTDNPEETITFTAPFNQIAPIVSNTGKQATNEMQALGSSITYMRRYLYMMALDICENDSIDANIGKDEDAPSPAPATKKAPATPGQRKEVKETLTDTEGNATPLQIKGLKAVLKKLREADPSKEDMIANIAVQTEGFTVISKSDCEELINRINEMLGEGGEE